MVNLDQLKLLVFGFSLSYLPYRLIDRVSVLTLVGLEVGILILGLWWTRRYRQHLWVIMGLLMIAAVGGEVYFRVSSFGLQGLNMVDYSPAAYGHPWSNFERSDYTYTGIAPNTQVVFKGATFSVNATGFRGKNYAYEKPKDVFRILTIGASILIGVGVNDEERFVALIEKELNDVGFSKRIEVVDLSIPGSTLGNRVHVLENEGRKYRPDMILFRLNPPTRKEQPFDIKQRKMGYFNLSLSERLLNEQWCFLSQRLFLARMLWTRTNGKEGIFDIDKVARRFREAPPKKTTVSAQKSATVPQQAVIDTALARLTDSFPDTRFVLLLLRPMKDLHKKDANREYRLDMQALAKRHKMPLIDSYEANFSGHRRQDLIIYPADQHPNATAHRIFGDYIAKQLIPMMN
jgi:lysophospholipase L1-like esterase